jgi:uncharacterized membrane protein YbhN (UPF0104 family)
VPCQLTTDAPPETSEPPPTAAVRRGAGSLLPKLAVSLLIASGFFWVLRRGGLPMFPASSAFARTAWWPVCGYVALYCMGAFLRTGRWIYLLRPMQPALSGRRVFGIGLLGFTAILFAPLRMGEVVRPWLLAQDGEVSFLQGTGTVAAERIVDGLTLTLILVTSLLIATPLAPLPEHVGKLPLPVSAVPRAATAALLFFAAAFIAMAIFYFWRARARRIVRAVLGPLSPGLADWVAGRVEKLADGLAFLPSRRYAGAFLRDTLLYWTVSSLSTWLLLRACGASASLAEACVTMGIMGIGTLIPSGPGFFGAYQLSAYCGLAMFFPESIVLSSGAVFTFVSYTTQILITAASGLLGLWLMAISPLRTPQATRGPSS